MFVLVTCLYDWFVFVNNLPCDWLPMLVSSTLCVRKVAESSQLCVRSTVLLVKCTTSIPWHAVTKHAAMKEKSAEKNKLLRRRHYTVDLKRNPTVWLVVWGGGGGFSSSI